MATGQPAAVNPGGHDGPPSGSLAAVGAVVARLWESIDFSHRRPGRDSANMVRCCCSRCDGCGAPPGATAGPAVYLSLAAHCPASPQLGKIEQSDRSVTG